MKYLRRSFAFLSEIRFKHKREDRGRNETNKRIEVKKYDEDILFLHFCHAYEMILRIKSSIVYSATIRIFFVFAAIFCCTLYCKNLSKDSNSKFYLKLIYQHIRYNGRRALSLTVDLTPSSPSYGIDFGLVPRRVCCFYSLERSYSLDTLDQSIPIRST